MKNLNDFCSTYKLCPFCGKELILKAERSVSTGIHGYLPEISIEERAEEILLTYEADNKFNKGMKLYLDAIIIDKFDNLVLYLFTDENVIEQNRFEDQLVFLLSSNYVALYMSCLCPAKYAMSLKPFILDNGSPKLVEPEIYSEYFTVDLDEKRVEIINLFTHDKTSVIFSQDNINGIPEVVYDVNIPFVKFDFSSKDAILNKINLLVNFS